MSWSHNNIWLCMQPCNTRISKFATQGVIYRDLLSQNSYVFSLSLSLSHFFSTLIKCDTIAGKPWTSQALMQWCCCSSQASCRFFVIRANSKIPFSLAGLSFHQYPVLYTWVFSENSISAVKHSVSSRTLVTKTVSGFLTGICSSKASECETQGNVRVASLTISRVQRTRAWGPQKWPGMALFLGKNVSVAGEHGCRCRYTAAGSYQQWVGVVSSLWSLDWAIPCFVWWWIQYALFQATDNDIFLFASLYWLEN